MDEKTLFQELLQDMLEQAQINGNRISLAEIQEYFEELNLSEEQMNHIYAYLVAHQITIQGFVPGADTEKTSRQYQTFGRIEEAKEETSQVEKRHTAKKGTAKQHTAQQEENKEPDSAFLKQYLKELRAAKKLTKEQERELAEKLLRLSGAITANQEDGFGVQSVADELLTELKERFVHHKLHSVVTKARTYAAGGELLDELVQEGNIGLLTALQKSGQYREAETFLTFVEEQITQAMETYLNGVYAADGEAQAMVAKVHFVSEAARAMKEENGQEPTLAELAAYTNLTEEELLAIVNLSPENLKA